MFLVPALFSLSDVSRNLVQKGMESIYRPFVKRYLMEYRILDLLIQIGGHNEDQFHPLFHVRVFCFFEDIVEKIVAASFFFLFYN